nr:NADH dehydrogenase subunit 2 [Oedogonium sp. BN3]
MKQATTILVEPTFWASSLDNLDILTWCPELFMLLGITVLLIYSIHYGAILYTEVCGGEMRILNNEINYSIPALSPPHTRIKGKSGEHVSTFARKAGQDYKKTTSTPPLLPSLCASTGSTWREGAPARVAAGPRDMITHLTQWCSIWLFLTIIVLMTHPWDHSLLFSSLFIRSKFSTGLSVFLFAYAFFCIQLSSQWLSYARAGRHVEYFIFILICLFGQHMLIQSIDLMSIYISLELQSFCLAILCSLNYKSQFSVEAGIKYFLLSAFSSGIMLLGISLIYWSTGLTNCTTIKELLFVNYSTDSTVSSAMGVDLLLMLGVWFVSLAFLWKLSAAPLHMWAADVYQGAWSSVTLFLSTLPKVAVFGCWISIWHGIWHSLWPETMTFFSALSMLVGAIAAMGQVHMKRLLAYSSINHIGILLMALCSQGGSSSALLTHLFIYLLTSLAVWGLILWPLKRPGHNNVVLSQYIWDFQILWKTQPLAAITWVIVMMSLAGLPPIAGFLGKLSVFWWTLNAHQYALLAIALLTTLLSSVYYLRVVRIMYMEAKPIKNWSSFTAMHTINAYLITISILGLLALLWYSSPLILYTHLICLVGA